MTLIFQDHSPSIVAHVGPCSEGQTIPAGSCSDGQTMQVLVFDSIIHDRSLWNLVQHMNLIYLFLFSPKDSLFEGTKCTRGRFEVEDHLQDVVCHWLCVFLNDYISDFGLSFCEDVVLVVIGTA